MKLQRLVLGILLATLAYAIVRYHVFKGVPWAQFPLYVVNKVAAVAGLAYIGVAPWRRSIEERKWLGNLGAILVAGHLLISLLILNPAYFAKFYAPADPGAAFRTMTWQAESSMLAGVVGLILLGWLCVASLRTAAGAQHGRRSLVPGLGRWILVATAAHVLLMGYQGWWPVSHWASAGYLPPITLLSFVMATGFILSRFVRRRSKASATDVPQPFARIESNVATAENVGSAGDASTAVDHAQTATMSGSTD